jgi:hypothetical protein
MAYNPSRDVKDTYNVLSYMQSKKTWRVIMSNMTNVNVASIIYNIENITK